MSAGNQTDELVNNTFYTPVNVTYQTRSMTTMNVHGPNYLSLKLGIGSSDQFRALGDHGKLDQSRAVEFYEIPAGALIQKIVAWVAKQGPSSEFTLITGL